jgi:hypothetical protein
VTQRLFLKLDTMGVGIFKEFGTDKTCKRFLSESDFAYSLSLMGFSNLSLTTEFTLREEMNHARNTSKN